MQNLEQKPDSLAARVIAARHAAQTNEFLLTQQDRKFFVECLLKTAVNPNSKLRKAVEHHALAFAG